MERRIESFALKGRKMYGGSQISCHIYVCNNKVDLLQKTMMVIFKSSKISLPAYPPVLSGYMVEFCDSFRDRVKVSRLLWPPFDFISKELTLRLPLCL